MFRGHENPHLGVLSCAIEAGAGAGFITRVRDDDGNVRILLKTCVTAFLFKGKSPNPRLLIIALAFVTTTSASEF